MLTLSGMIPPAVTPLTSSRTVDGDSVHRLTEHLIAGGADALFVLGSCGEGPTLPPQLALEAVDAFRGAIRGRVPLLVGVGDTSTERVLEAARRATDVGCDALAVMPPMYYETELDLPFVRHVEAVARVTPLPLVIYNIPHLTHHPITPNALRTVAELDSVIALKESSGDWDVYAPLAEAARETGLAVFQGAEALITRSIAEGAAGAVPGIANVVPELAASLVHRALAGEPVGELQARLDEVCELYAAGFWLACLKNAVELLEITGATMGEALPALSQSGRERVHEVIRRLPELAQLGATR